MSWLRRYVGENQVNWDEFSNYLRFAYNRTVLRSTYNTPFSLVIRRKQPEPIGMNRETYFYFVQNGPPHRDQVRSQILNRLTHMVKETDKKTTKDQERYNKYFYKTVRPRKRIETRKQVYRSRRLPTLSSSA